MRIIKKYSNRRLYDTQTSAYINLRELIELIRQGESLQIIAAKSAKDISQDILLQALIECNCAQILFSSSFLHRIIRLSSNTEPQSEHLEQLATDLAALDAKFTHLEEQLAAKPQPAPTSTPVSSPESLTEPPQHPTVRTASTTEPLLSDRLVAQATTEKPASTVAKPPQPTPPSSSPDSSPPSQLKTLRNRLADLESRLRGSD